jgi:hypothetical protein
LEVLFPEKKVKLGQRERSAALRFSGLSTSKVRCVFPGTVLPKFWKYCSRKNVAASKAYRGRVWVRWPNFTFFIFPGTVLPKCILEVLFPEKCRRGRESSLSRASAPALIAGERSSAGPILPFFIFPGTVLPFFYFSVVRKVPEKPVLFLPHPSNTG